MSIWGVVIFVLTGFVISYLCIPVIQRYLKPSSRRQFHHTHQTPISRFGGLAIFAAFAFMAAISFLFYPVNDVRTFDRWIIVGSASAMFLLGFIDDAWPLGARRKLLGQILIASAVWYCGIQIDKVRNPLNGADYFLGGWGYFATVFWLVAFTNLINLIDGIDGVAGGISLMVMGLLLYMGFQSDMVFPVICVAGICGALLAFLRSNFPPARIYLGDGGAYFLGFLSGILAMHLSRKGAVTAALIAPLFALALPIVDAALAIVRRGLKGIPIFRPDRRHLHHRLAEAGLSRTRIVLGFYSCSLFFLLLAFVNFVSQGLWLPLSLGAGCLVLLVLAYSFSFSREWFSVGKVLGRSLQMRPHIRYATAMSRCLQLEAERAVSSEELWTDFVFFTKKLGFSSVTLSTPEGRKHSPWNQSPIPGTAPETECVRCALAHGTSMEFAAPTGAMDRRSFELLSELAAETWVKTSQRWEKVNQMELKLAGPNQVLLNLPVSSTGAIPCKAS